MADRTRELLNEVRRIGTGFKVFGAGGHRYHSTPVPEAEVEAVERELGVGLPPEYRRFLFDVGHGAGPYYGLYPPRQAAAEIDGLCAELEGEVGTRVRPLDRFPLTADDVTRIDQRVDAGDRAPWAKRDWPSGGCLPLGHQGCTFYSVLVLTGEFTGRVWDVVCYTGYDGEWLPARRPPGWWAFGMPNPKPLPPLPRPPTFGEWYAGWLERCLTDLDPRHAPSGERPA